MQNLDRVYYDVSGSESFGSVAGLMRQSRQPREKVKEFLAKQNAYTLHRKAVSKFQRRKTFAKGINDLWQMDLVDLSWMARENDGYRYLLTCIDVVSKYG